MSTSVMELEGQTALVTGSTSGIGKRRRWRWPGWARR
jgi:hypothetical protein